MYPTGCGIGLRSPHVAEILATSPGIPWLEIHAENYMGGGPTLRSLERLRGHYPVSVHGVGLSLGTTDGIDERHLERLAHLVDRVKPALVSEHLSWSVSGGVYLNHLLPLPYTEETLDTVAAHVARVQDRLGTRLLIENPSNYLRYQDTAIAEPQFLNELAARTGCGVLCDVNNVYVTCTNLCGDADAWIDALHPAIVGEVHLAGHAINDADGRPILIDDHGSTVSVEVWKLYARALTRFGPVPTLVEWDTDVPELSVLMGEAHKAERMLEASGARDVVAA